MTAIDEEEGEMEEAYEDEDEGIQSNEMPLDAKPVAQQPVAHSAPRRAATAESFTAPAPKASPGVYQQSSFNLQPEEVPRFKGTEKTFVEGQDLDTPTWMRKRTRPQR